MSAELITWSKRVIIISICAAVVSLFINLPGGDRVASETTIFVLTGLLPLIVFLIFLSRSKTIREKEKDPQYIFIAACWVCVILGLALVLVALAPALGVGSTAGNLLSGALYLIAGILGFAEGFKLKVDMIP